MAGKTTAIVTGASQGIGAAVVQAFLDRGYNVVATSRGISKAHFAPSPHLALVNAGIFAVKSFTDYSIDELRRFVSTNLEGFIFVTQLAVKQMLSQGTGGSVTSITTSFVDHPNAAVHASIPMITKGGLDAVTRNLAIEYAKHNIRFNAVAPGQVDTPLHKNSPKELLRSLSPMGTISDARDIADAVVYLTEARHVTGEVLHVDGGAHVGKW